MSQIATTIEQSKRLLNAGLDPGCADMYWGHVDFGGGRATVVLPANPCLDINSTISPAWSLSKLMEILDHDIYIGYDDLFDGLVNDVLYIISHGEIKQEYLKRNDNRNATENE